MLSSQRQVTSHDARSKTLEQYSNKYPQSRHKNRQKIASAQAMTQGIKKAAIKTARAAVQAMVVATVEAGAGPRSKAMSLALKLGGP